MNNEKLNNIKKMVLGNLTSARPYEKFYLTRTVAGEKLKNKTTNNASHNKDKRI